MARVKKKETLTTEERLQAALVPENEQPYKVPGNWCWTALKHISSHISDGSHNPPKDSGKGIPLLSATNIHDHLIDIDSAVRWITEDQWTIENQRTKIETNDVLLTIVASIGRTAVVKNEQFALQRSVAVIKPKINSEFLSYYFETPYIQQFMLDNAKGTAQKGFYLNSLVELFCCVPPLAEQQRIVDRIESLFAKLDEAKQNVQDALDNFETRKAAILHKAFTGELTAKWRKEHGVGMETWSSCKLIDILVEKPRNGYSPKPVDYVTACKSMTLSATTTGVFKPEFFKYIDEEIPENSHLWLTPGDILIQRANSLEKVGMSAIYTGAEHEFIYPDLMMKLTVKEPNNKHYIDYYLKTDEILNYFRSNATGTAGNMPKINQKVVSETPLILPETQEQAEIVRLLDDLLAKEQQAKEAAEGVLEQIDLMKKAILARAFRGELGTNDPNEESAVELVKRALSN